ncbi:cytochrome c [Candidatus Chlorohelix sp.]|uniref:c-type cytochrome n=1 Tax=Candidatus Chlorohelix sp. TaxID=3139201 RepID=UPI0030499CF6
MIRQNPIIFLLVGLICLLLLVACSDEVTQSSSAISTTIVPTTQAVVNITPVATIVAATLPILTQTTVAASTTPPVSKPNTTATTAVTTLSVAGGTAVERGKNLFILVGCAACHGQTARGAYGPKIAATKLSYTEVLMQVRNPRPSTVNSMIPFRQEELPDSQVADIYAFLQSLN